MVLVCNWDDPSSADVDHFWMCFSVTLYFYGLFSTPLLQHTLSYEGACGTSPVYQYLEAALKWLVSVLDA
jgi:hypothetical protein